MKKYYLIIILLCIIIISLLVYFQEMYNNFNLIYKPKVSFKEVLIDLNNLDSINKLIKNKYVKFPDSYDAFSNIVLKKSNSYIVPEGSLYITDEILEKLNENNENNEIKIIIND